MTGEQTAVERAAERLAKRAQPFHESIWAMVDGMMNDHPDMVFFGSGVPARELFPVERLQESSAAAWADGLAALDYGEAEGYGPLRQLIAERMRRHGAQVDPDDIVITNGSQQGIDNVVRAVVDPGEVVLVEAPTFMDAIRIFRSHGAEVVGVPMDDEGMRPDALRATLARLRSTPRILYLIPTYQNPTGITMSLPRRREILGAAREAGMLVLEDDPYGELRYDDVELPSLRALDPAVIHLGTFSKTFAPGLRIGWVVTGDPLRRMLLSIKEGTDIQTERIMTRTVYHAVRGYLDDHLDRAREIYRGRRDAMVHALEREMPAGTTWTVPEGGFFVWVQLPEGMNADDLLPAAARNGVIYLPGSWFFPDRSEVRGLRLNFSTLPEERIVEGVRRLGETLRAALG